MSDISEWEKRRQEKINKTNDFIILIVLAMFLLMAVRFVWSVFS